MSSTPVSDAARAAFEPVRAREQAHAVALLDERKRRGEHHFQRVFGVPQTAVLEGAEIVFTVDGKHRLVYVGNLRDSKRMVGPGWLYLERCAGCKTEQGVAFVATLADLGRLITDGLPEWECRRCTSRH